MLRLRAIVLSAAVMAVSGCTWNVNHLDQIPPCAAWGQAGCFGCMPGLLPPPAAQPPQPQPQPVPEAPSEVPPEEEPTEEMPFEDMPATPDDEPSELPPDKSDAPEEMPSEAAP